MIAYDMDSHPIPQDITSFQFRLIGDMTLKQFTYLASGAGIAYVIFVFFSQSFPAVAWPLILFFSGTGAAFAFIPISDRPLDHWLVTFVKAITHPTKRFWRNKNLQINESVFKNRFLVYYNQIHAPQQPALVNKPRLPVISQMAPATAVLVTPASSREATPAAAQVPKPAFFSPSQQTPSEDDNLKKLVETAQEAQIIQTQIAETQNKLQNLKVQTQAADLNTPAYSTQYETIITTLKTLNQQTQLLESELTRLAPNRPEPKKAKVITIVPPKVAPIQLSLTQIPNIINGVVTDAQNNYLEGVIVVTHDKEGLPVRALRTNKLGQFIAATPLPNGVYTVTLEKDSLSFDTLQIELNGGVLLPIKVAAKTGANTQ